MIVSNSAAQYTVSEERVQLEGTRYSVPRRFSAWVSAEDLSAPHNARLEVTFAGEADGWQVDSFTAERDEWDEEAPGVTTESLREMPVAWALRQALAAMAEVAVDDAGHTFRQVYDSEIETNRQARGDGPTPANLARLAEIYRVSRLSGQLTSSLIANAFGLPDRTVSHWIKLARQRGHLDALPEKGAS